MENGQNFHRIALHITLGRWNWYWSSSSARTKLLKFWKTIPFMARKMVSSICGLYQCPLKIGSRSFVTIWVWHIFPVKARTYRLYNHLLKKKSNSGNIFKINPNIYYFYLFSRISSIILDEIPALTPV